MTVTELIDKLKEMPGDLPVCFLREGTFCHVIRVEEDKIIDWEEPNGSNDTDICFIG